MNGCVVVIARFRVDNGWVFVASAVSMIEQSSDALMMGRGDLAVNHQRLFQFHIDFIHRINNGGTNGRRRSLLAIVFTFVTGFHGSNERVVAVLIGALRGRTVLDVVQFFLSGGGVKGLDFIAILLRDRTDAEMFSGHEGFFVGHWGHNGGCLVACRGGPGYIAGAGARMDLFNTGTKGGVIICCIADGLVDRQILLTGKRVPNGIVDRFIWID